MTTQPDQDKGKITAYCHNTTNEVAARLTDVVGKMQAVNNTTIKNTKKARMMINQDIKRWFDNNARGSKPSAESKLRRLSLFCQNHQMTPMQVAELGIKDVKTITDLLVDHVIIMEEKGYAPRYILAILKAVKSWLRHFDVYVQRKIQVINAHMTPTLENERVPNAVEMTEIFNSASQRDVIIISLMAKSGLRPEVIGNHDGTDGLKMKDLPDIAIQGGVAICTQKPMRIIVRAELSKTRHQYFTLATTVATCRILSYLNERLSRGEAPRKYTSNIS